MQAMAYSGYQSPQQMTMEPAAFFADSVIPMVAGWEHSQWLVVRDDFRIITGKRRGAAEVLRLFERLTNRKAAKLRKEHGIPEDCQPHDDDLRISVSFEEISDGIMEFWLKKTCWQIVYYLIELGFLKQCFIARKTAAVIDQPAVPIYEDGEGFYIFVDRDDCYIDINGETHNAKREGYDIEWQYLLCFDAIRAAIAKAAWLIPPEPAKRWPPIVKRRDPVREQSSDAPTSTDCPPSDVESATNAQPLPSQTSCVIGGTKNDEICEELGSLHDTVDTSDMSTVHREIPTNVPVTPAIPSQAEAFENAPWCTETLIGLAQSRVVPGLFEVTGGDEDEEGAEKLDELRQRLGYDPTRFWPLLDCHIAAMMDKGSGTWFATKRKGPDLRFHLTHVANNWNAVEDTLTKKSWSPLDTVPYFGPPRADNVSLIFGDQPGSGADPFADEKTARHVDAPRYESEETGPPHYGPTFIEESTPTIERSLALPGNSIEETQYAQDDVGPPGETEQNDMYPPAEEWAPPKRGMDQIEYDALCSEIWQRYPTLSLKAMPYLDGSLACGIEHHPGEFMRVRNTTEWRRPSTSQQRAVKDAVAYGRTMQGLHGMGLAEYDALRRFIGLHYPMLILGTVTFDDGSTGISIGYAEDRWTEPIRCEAEWYDPPPGIRQIMLQALRYGRLRKINES